VTSPFAGPLAALSAGPSAVLSAARATVGGILALPARVIDLVDRAEVAVARIEVLIDSAAATAARAAEVAEAAGIVAIEADRVARVSGVVATDARGVVAGAGEVEQEISALVRAYEPALVTLQPTLIRLAESTDPREVDALVGLVDRLPPLLESMDSDVMPLLGKLNDMAPDLHALLESVNELRATIAGLPGMGLLRRRGEDKLDDEAPTPTAGATRAPTP
jgi:hypothetical protein